jgi:hypothetical protein
MINKNILAAAAGFTAGYFMFKKSNAAVGANKYTYYKVIQQNWGYGWDDVDFYEVDSRGFFRTTEERQIYMENLKKYKTEPGQPYPRVILRKELNKSNVGTNNNSQDYKIVRGWDHYNSKPLYQVNSTSDSENEYVGEWHTNIEEAKEELAYLKNRLNR